MAIERERKFLVAYGRTVGIEDIPGFQSTAKLTQDIVTGYFTKDEVALRVSKASTYDPIKNESTLRCKVCIKGPGEESRLELEYDITEDEANQLLSYSPTILTKTRYRFRGWEIDSMHLAGIRLIVAEWEFGPGREQLPSPLPEWIGMDITGIKQFTNQALAWEFGTHALAEGIQHVRKA